MIKFIRKTSSKTLIAKADFLRNIQQVPTSQRKREQYVLRRQPGSDIKAVVGGGSRVYMRKTRGSSRESKEKRAVCDLGGGRIAIFPGSG